VTLYTLFAGGGLAGDAAAVAGLQHRPLLGRRPRIATFTFPRALHRLHHALLEDRPEVLHSGLEPTNILAALAARESGTPVVWGVRCSGIGLGWKYSLYLRVGARLRRRAAYAICNSREGFANHRRLGYLPEHATVIPNGVDLEKFQPLPADRERMRARIGVAPRHILVGLVARLDPVKRHDLFLQAAAAAAAGDPRLRFVCVTPRESPLPPALRALSEAEPLLGRLHWVTAGGDIASWYRALDLFVSTSSSEGFSNSIAESMACGTPCLVTDVGDSALLVGTEGKVVPSGDASALARGMLEIAGHPGTRRRAMGQAARERIVRNFSLDALVHRTEEILSCVAGGGTPCAA
jgi:glycosyltransferase involved in cell wall biosynthesis